MPPSSSSTAAMVSPLSRWTSPCSVRTPDTERAEELPVAKPRQSDADDGRRTAATEPPVVRRLSLRIRESDRPTDDRRLLDDVKRLLLEYGGEDEVRLEIASNGLLVTLEWPLVRVNASPELEDQLRQVLGEAGGVTLESPAS